VTLTYLLDTLLRFHKMNKDSYDPLLNDDDAGLEGHENSQILQKSQWRRWSRHIIACNIVLPWLTTFLLVVILVYHNTNGADRFRQHKLYPAQLTYSPAQEAIRYKVQSFHQNIEDAPSEFQGPPSHQLDKAWTDLYQCKFSIR